MERFHPKDTNTEIDNLESKFSKEQIEDFKNALEGREIIETFDVLLDIISNTQESNLVSVSKLLIENKELIKNSTIAVGKTFNGQSVGQALLRGNIETPLVQVYIIKGFNEIVDIFKGITIFVDFKYDDREKYNRTVLHELLHSFTRYIVSIAQKSDIDVLSPSEKTFYMNIDRLHKEFLEQNNTGDIYLDSIDEFIVKSMTSDFADNGMFNEYWFDKVFKEFREMYSNNTRHIQSISKIFV